MTQIKNAIWSTSMQLVHILICNTWNERWTQKKKIWKLPVNATSRTIATWKIPQSWIQWRIKSWNATLHPMTNQQPTEYVILLDPYWLRSIFYTSIAKQFTPSLFKTSETMITPRDRQYSRMQYCPLFVILRIDRSSKLPSMDCCLCFTPAYDCKNRIFAYKQ